MADLDIRLAEARVRVEERRRQPKVIIDRVCQNRKCNVSLVKRRPYVKFCCKACRDEERLAVKRKPSQTEPRICANPDCNNILTGRQFVTMYCSVKCGYKVNSVKYRVERLTRKCVNPDCDNLIIGKNKRAKYCSMNCCSKMWRRNKSSLIPIKFCLNPLCGKPLVGKLTIKYCDSKCRNAVYRARLKEENPDHLISRWRRAKLRRLNTCEVDILPVPDKCINPFCSNIKVVIDHDHITNEFRGWICKRCNTVIGMAKDDARIVGWLADYLNRFGLDGQGK